MIIVLLSFLIVWHARRHRNGDAPLAYISNVIGGVLHDGYRDGIAKYWDSFVLLRRTALGLLAVLADLPSLIFLINLGALLGKFVCLCVLCVCVCCLCLESHFALLRRPKQRSTSDRSRTKWNKDSNCFLSLSLYSILFISIRFGILSVSKSQN